MKTGFYLLISRVQFIIIISSSDFLMSKKEEKQLFGHSQPLKCLRMNFPPINHYSDDTIKQKVEILVFSKIVKLNQ
jgi:hypothetical protein